MTTDADLEYLRAKLWAVRRANAEQSGQSSEDVAHAFECGMARALVAQLRQLAALADRALTLDGRALAEALRATSQVRSTLLSTGM